MIDPDDTIPAPPPSGAVDSSGSIAPGVSNLSTVTIPVVASGTAASVPLDLDELEDTQ